MIEGCYTDLLALVEDKSTKIIFMKLPVEVCISSAKAWPWEPHKYESKQAQDENLEMLIGWIGQYTEREDTFSYSYYQKFYDNFSGQKRVVTRNQNYI
ncbi:hypothetical protein [Kangiella sediminilitoris]|uniref:Shikimate kinase n=1 Tax=Kangiella sediminilitoris TaxID=1144748 RepID=A0A1B3B7K5_9GAMM|nr:hypothetical protein [Kangiella sediminilitoris]AOE48772.1 Shikimate kinase [Kangiella sediminilitoris]